MLKPFQDSFSKLILSGALADSSANIPPALQSVLKQGDIPLHERLSIYHNNVLGSLTSVILNTYPTITKLVGADFAEAMAKAYVLQSPPHVGCLNLYGSDYPDFIATFEPAQGLPYLPSIAQIESHKNQSFYAVDEPPLTAEILQPIPTQDLLSAQLPLSKSCSFFSCTFPALDIYSYTNADNQDELTPPDINTHTSQYILTSRSNYNVQTQTIDAAYFALLSQIAQGEILENALEKTLTAHPDFNLPDFLSFALAHHIFTPPRSEKD